MPAINAPTTTTTIFFFLQPQATPASHQLHTSNGVVGIQTLVRVGGRNRRGKDKQEWDSNPG